MYFVFISKFESIFVSKMRITDYAYYERYQLDLIPSNEQRSGKNTMCLIINCKSINLK